MSQLRQLMVIAGLEAASEELVREAYARAGVRFHRISTTLEDEASAVASSPSEIEAKEDR